MYNDLFMFKYLKHFLGNNKSKVTRYFNYVTLYYYMLENNYNTKQYE